MIIIRRSTCLYFCVAHSMSLRGKNNNCIFRLISALNFYVYNIAGITLVRIMPGILR